MYSVRAPRISATVSPIVGTRSLTIGHAPCLANLHPEILLQECEFLTGVVSCELVSDQSELRRRWDSGEVPTALQPTRRWNRDGDTNPTFPSPLDQSLLGSPESPVDRGLKPPRLVAPSCS